MSAVQDGDTPLHVAVSWGHEKMVNLLVDRGGSLLLKNKSKRTPLDLACPGERLHFVDISFRRVPWLSSMGV